MLLSVLLATGVLTYPAAAATARTCRAAPGSPDWPSVETWASLNTTLEGRLLKPVLAAAVCYRSRPEFDREKCREVLAAWQTQEFHMEDPISVQGNHWTDWSCLPRDPDAEESRVLSSDEMDMDEHPDQAAMLLPETEDGAFRVELQNDAEHGCSGRGYPAYVVNATTSQDVKAAVDFAREQNVRLGVKNTGHDVPGRSNAPGSLSIWTHHLKHIEFHNGSFTLTGSGRAVDGHYITAGSGCQNYQLQQFAHKHGLVFTGGGSKSVAMGGFVSGGGHSILSPHYGLAADNVLQMEVVTPGGEVLTVNEDQHADLFWALRGGGGSTFGVVTLLVLRLHPDRPVEHVLFFGITEPGSDTARDVVPWGISKSHELMEQGISGYMFASHSIVSPFPIPGAAEENSLIGGFVATAMIIDPEDNAVENALEPLQKEAEKRFGDKVQVGYHKQHYDTFLDWFEVHHDKGPAGHSGYIVSRLLDKATLKDEERLGRIMEAAMAPSWGVGVYMIAGKGVHDAKVPGGSNAVHPSWRESMVLAMTWKSFASYDSQAGQEVIDELNEAWQPMREQMPDSGSYVNEGLNDERDWQKSFWGANYDRLLQIKRDVDPTDVFWCKPCVGYDRWVEVSTEEGKQLCRVE